MSTSHGDQISEPYVNGFGYQTVYAFSEGMGTLMGRGKSRPKTSEVATLGRTCAYKGLRLLYEEHVQMTM